ncbi:MAG: multidrug effflux MFS transporter [Pararhodobacter sp.]
MTATTPEARTPAPRFAEFVALMALLMATVAYSVDSMLPLLDAMGEALSPDAPQRAQLVITSFVLGLGAGTLVTGPMSDAFGRKPVVMAGIALYMLAAVVAALADSIAWLLVARFVQGLGTSAPRVVSQAMVRDLYAGRMMARVISFSMTIFTLVPAIAPLMGAGLGAVFGWRAIFWSFLGFGLVSGGWMLLRQPETLPPERRRALALRPLWLALRDVLGHRQVRLFLLAQTFVYTTMFVWLAEVALVYDQAFDRGVDFPFWFALVALLSAPASMLNARLVIRLGMRRLVTVALLALAGVALVVIGALILGKGAIPFALFFAFMVLQFFSIGFLLGNLNALALEPMGHVAGMAASVMSGVATVASALLAAPVVRFHDGTPLPIAMAVLLCTLAALVCMARAGGRDDL